MRVGTVAYAKDFASARHSRRRNLYGAIMEAMRESWTDDRMDDLNGKVDALRLETRTEFKAIRGGDERGIRRGPGPR